MATQWNSVEVQTEKVIDENPAIWVSASRKSLEDKNYIEALTNAEQAITFIKKAATSSARALLPECYAVEIYAHYERGEGAKAQKLKDEHFDSELKRFLMDKPEYVIVFKWHNNTEWMPLWQEMIAEWVKTANFTRIEKYDELIDNHYLASVCDNAAVVKSAEKNSLKFIEKIHASGYNLSAVTNGDNDNLTMIALGNGHNKLAEFLLDKRINDVNAANNDGETALMIAAEKGFSSIVEHLINSGAKVNTRDKNQTTALMVSSNDEIAKLMINAGANVNARDDLGATALILLAGGGYESVVQCLIDAGADINAKIPSSGITALMNAVGNEHDGTAKILIKFGADVNAISNDDGTALAVSVVKDNLEITRALIRAGADVNFGRNGNDILGLAAEHASLNVIESVLDGGANPDKLYDGKTLLHILATGEHWSSHSITFWRMLLSHGANPNIKDTSGRTPLEYALDHTWYLSDELDMPRALVRAGAEITSTARSIMKRKYIEPSALRNDSSSNVGTKLFGALNKFFNS